VFSVFDEFVTTEEVSGLNGGTQSIDYAD
jgi:hypothetical protein